MPHFHVFCSSEFHAKNIRKSISPVVSTVFSKKIEFFNNRIDSCVVYHFLPFRYLNMQKKKKENSKQKIRVSWW